MLLGFVCIFLNSAAFKSLQSLCNYEEHGHLWKLLAARKWSQSHDSCQLSVDPQKSSVNLNWGPCITL